MTDYQIAGPSVTTPKRRSTPTDDRSCGNIDGMAEVKVAVSASRWSEIEIVNQTTAVTHTHRPLPFHRVLSRLEPAEVPVITEVFVRLQEMQKGSVPPSGGV